MPERVKLPVPFNTKDPLPAMIPAMVEEPPWLMISEAEALPMVMVTPPAAMTPPAVPAVNVRLLALLQLRLVMMVMLPTPLPAVPELVVRTVTLLFPKLVTKSTSLILDVLAPESGV